MSIKPGSGYAPAAKVFSGLAGVIIFVLGASVLTGWIFNIPALKSVLPGFVTMKANTALSFLLIGISLWFSQLKHAGSIEARIAAKSCALIVASIGALTLFEYIFNVSVGIDQFIFTEDPGALFTTYPGRMALTTAINFTVLGAALMLLDAKSRRVYYPLQIFTIMTIAVSLLSVAGYIYGVSAFYGRISGYTAMALHTAVAFVTAGIAILAARPDRGLAAILTGNSVGGIVVRTLLPIAIIIPLSLGWLKLHGEKAGFFNNEFGAALVAIGNLTIMVLFILRSGILINRAEDAARITEDKVAEAGIEWEKTFNAISDIILILDTDQTIRRANKIFFETFKLAPEDVIGKKCYEVLHGMNKPWPVCPLDKTMRDMTPFTEEVDDPKIGIPLLVTTSPIFDNDGKITEIVHIARDVSHIKNIEKELNRKIENLERFQKITVGRELKMKELKSRIGELEMRLNTKPQ